MQLPLPSGLTLEVRKIKGAELVTLAERAESSDGAQLTDVLKGCFQSVLEPGPYRFAAAGAAQPDWMRVLKGDILAAVFALRAASVPNGDSYAFPVKCEECGRRYDWEVKSLSRDLPIVPLPEESRRIIADGGRFEAKTLGGVGLTYALMTPKDDEPAKKFMRKLGRKQMSPIETLAVKTRTIDGIQGAERDITKRWNFFKGLDLEEILDLTEKLDASEGGIDLEIRTRCHGVDGCGWEQDIILPLRRTFFSPRKKAPMEVEADPNATAPPSSSSNSSPG